MLKRSGSLIIAVVWLLSASGALAQRATERYIPIGKSPGLSNKVTLMGKIEGRDDQAQTIGVASPDGSKTVKVNKETRIWLETDAGIEETIFPICNQYTIEGDVVSKAILDEAATPTPLSDAVGNMRVIDAIFDSNQSSTWVNL